MYEGRFLNLILMTLRTVKAHRLTKPDKNEIALLLFNSMFFCREPRR